MIRLKGLAAAAVVLAVMPVFTHPQDQSQRVLSFRIIVLESADEAERVRQQLLDGANILELAQRLSVDPSGRTGGLVGPVALGDLRPQLRDVLQRLRVGELSDVVPLPTGFAILKIAPGIEARADDTRAATPASSGTIMTALNAGGAVKYVFDLSGYTENVVSLRRAAIPPDAYQNFATFCQLRRQLVDSARSLLDKALAAGSSTAPTTALDRAQAYFLQAQLHAYRGEMAAAIASLENARRIADTDVPDLRLQLDQALGVAHLHKAEIDNRVLHEPGARCLLLEKPEQPFANTADVVKAIEYFSRYLAGMPNDLEVRWLLNLAHMFAGTYPDKVPGGQLVPPSAFSSAEQVERFHDVAPRAGLVSVASAGGLIVDDFDNDGRLDIVTSSLDSCDGMRFFSRTADGRFIERAATAGLADQLGSLNILQTDYNNDGALDILVLRGAWEMPLRKSLLRNNGNGTFTDVTVASGLAGTLTGTQSAVWTDVDNDGFVDLFVGVEDGPAQLFRNRGDGTFEDIAAKAGVARRAFNKGVAAADYDNDGWQDLYVSNLGGVNFLYRNNHDGTFTESGRAAGAPGPGQGFPTWFFDYDNDGHPDLFAASFVTSVDEAARAYLRLPRNGDGLKLYRNLGDGSFEDVTQQVGLDKSLMVMGSNFGDIDNDGYLDMYLGTGNPSYAALVPSLLLRNNAGKSFVDVTGSSGTGELHKGHGVAFADLDNDGDEEIVFEVGGATPGDVHALRLFENPGHGNDWITVKLVGVKTNRPAFGARITATVHAKGTTRSIHRTVGSGGSFGASPLQQHIGLGPGAERVDLEVWWPTSNTRQRFPAIGKNRFVEITELARDYVSVERTPLPLGKRN